MKNLLPYMAAALLKRLFATLCLLAAMALPSLAQNIDLAAGPSDPATGNFHLTIPIGPDKPGFHYTLEINAHVIAVSVNGGSQFVNEISATSGTLGSTSMSGTEWQLVPSSVSTTQENCHSAQGEMWTYSGASIQLPSGENHPLPSSFTWRSAFDTTCNQYPASAITTDGSGYTVVPTSNFNGWVVYDKSGNKFNIVQFPILGATTVQQYPLETNPDGVQVAGSGMVWGHSGNYFDELGCGTSGNPCNSPMSVDYSNAGQYTYTYNDGGGTPRVVTV